MYGWKLYSYRTLLDAAQTMISLQLGIFNYEEVRFQIIMIVPETRSTVVAHFFFVICQVLDYNPVLGAFLIGSCIVFMTFVVLNLFISVVLVAFSQEQIHHRVTHPWWHFIYKNTLLSLSPLYNSPFSVQPSEDEEIVDLMLMKLGSLFGLKCKKQGGGDQTRNATSSNNEPSTVSPGNSFSSWTLWCS